MTLPRPLFFLGRACFGSFVFLTSGYCLLNYVPFTYHQIHLAGLLAWLTTFVRIHPYLYWGVLGLLVLTLIPDIGRRKTKILTLGFIIFCTDVGIILLFHPLLSELQNDIASLFWGLASLLPLLWLAAIDWLGQGSTLTWGTTDSSEESRIFRAAWQAAIFLSLVYAAIFYVRYGGSAATGFGLREGILAMIWTVVSHLLLFMALFVILFLVRAVAELFENRSKMEFLFYGSVACLSVTVIMRYLICQQIAFEGPRANIFSIAAGISFGASFGGLSVRLYRAKNNPVQSGLALLLTPLRWGRILPSIPGFPLRAVRFIPLLLIALLAYFLAVKSAVLDWNYLLQELSVVFIWTATFANFYELAPRKETRGDLPAIAMLFAAAATLGVYKTLGLWQSHHQGLARYGNVAAMLDNYTGYDVSFKLAYDTLSPAQGSSSFYKFLTENTNISQSTETKPVEVNLVGKLSKGNSAKPNIFIFVIDSLRRDYLSPYNPAVTFTPSIQSFAHESVVMENAFTQYGGTGLSEPSIWVGGMLLHKQYVTPFYPMNALQKLLEAEKYQSFISLDSILNVVVRPSPSITELDSGVPERQYDFCKSLDDLENKITERDDSASPIFAYTQAQNIHISVITREGESVPPGETYPGFYAPYASRIRRMDGCFGKFDQFLKKSHLFEKSIVILTSDHGDSLGENGRWGHAYTIFPEIIQIPLIIHLPPALRDSLFSNPSTVAFLTDITPSLYYILGHKPILENGIFGRPLFLETQEEETGYLRDSYLLASSYGPVYGILQNNGHSLYVADGVNYKDYIYDLPQNPHDIAQPVSATVRDNNERMIRDHILAINRFYRFAQPR